MWGKMRTADREKAPQITEKLPQRGGGGGQHVYDFVERRIQAIRHTFFQKAFTSLMKLSASHEKESSP